MQTIQDNKIKGIAIWFYIIAAFQVVAAFMTWNSGSGDPDLAVAAMVLAGMDIFIGVLFVVFGYYAAKKQPWAFVAGLILYALRALLQFMQLFSPIALIIRAFLMFRIFQGLQACIAANRADQAMSLLNQRRLVMPQASAAPIATGASGVPTAPVEPAVVPQAWVPARGPQAQPQPSSAE